MRGNAFFRKVVEGMRCGIMTVDGEGRVLTVNELARGILELDDDYRENDAEQEGARRHVGDVLAHHPRLAEVLLDSLRMSHLPNRAEMEIRTREADGRTIGFTISPILGQEGPEGVALFFKDLTQVEQREEQERLRDRLVALGQMAASMAHEIRNPLASIEVTATLLRRRLEKQGEDTRLVEKIVDEVSRLNATVTSGLEFARVISPERVEREVGPVVEGALEEALNRFPAHSAEIVRAFDPSAPRVPIDENLLKQVFVNLIVNALEATEGKGRIELRVDPVCRPDKEPGATEIVIADDGPGIPGEVREKIFYPFVTTKKGGSGIGLAMARKIVESHHGFIDVESRRGATRFIIRLPRAARPRDED